MPSASTQNVIDSLRLKPEIDRLRACIQRWVEGAAPAVRTMLEHQFHAADTKYFRPLTVFSCHRAMTYAEIPDALIVTAQVVEMFHNVSLIIDDIVDDSAQRRGKDTIQHLFGKLQAYMVSGYIISDGYDILAKQVVHEFQDMRESLRNEPEELLACAVNDRACREDVLTVDRPERSVLDACGLVARSEREALEISGPVRYDIRLLSELLKRLAVAECVQWDNRKSRKYPVAIADWYFLAREDTGSMFEVCAALGARTQRLRRFGRLLGMLYHGCDDVADVRNAKGLGGGGAEDLEEGILTLPAALAIQNPSVRAVFCKDVRTDQDKRTLLKAYQDQLDAAERELDDIQAQAEEEAHANAPNPEALLPLIKYVRPLSAR
jgi:geranylgeranyl pyrophosphate synthase